MLASRGEITPPCGVPQRLGITRFLPAPSSSTIGARSHALISLSTLPSLTRRATCRINACTGHPLSLTSACTHRTSNLPWRIAPRCFGGTRPPLPTDPRYYEDLRLLRQAHPPYRSRRLARAVGTFYFPSPQSSQLTLASLPDVLSTLTPPKFCPEADGCLLCALRPSPFR